MLVPNRFRRELAFHLARITVKLYLKLLIINSITLLQRESLSTDRRVSWGKQEKSEISAVSEYLSLCQL